MKNIIRDSSRLFLGGNVLETYQNFFGTNKVYGAVKPVSETEVIACVKYANAHQMPIITRGANTGDVWQVKRQALDLKKST